MQAKLPVQLLVTPGASVAEVTVKTDHFELFSTGEAKTHPVDDAHDEIGAALALSRALEGLADDLHAYAYKKINNR